MHILGAEACFEAIGELIQDVTIVFEIVTADVTDRLVADKSQEGGEAPFNVLAMFAAYLAFFFRSSASASLRQDIAP